MPWWWNGTEKRNFSVVIYEKDYKELCAWVLKKPNIETGGDLFGLWADKHTAVIQLVLGPGKQCKRTTASFYQDIDYLRRVGSYLTQNEGVCHIGEWHSHHQLGLARPSGGDENTVWNNMPTYNLKRFVIFIANIQSSRDSYNVDVGCFLFEIDDKGQHMDVLPGKFTILQRNSPLSEKREVTEERKKGAEKDDENNIALKELTMEVRKGEKSPSVRYLRPITSPNSEPRKRAGRWNGGQKRTFSVMIYEKDYKELCAWVLKKPNIETGGDLFGLWADKHTAVIQLVLGPGKQCARTTTSFYQDIDYLRRVGSYLTQNEGMCHIGEWHSHHQLGLARPSGGDENTVWNNMPTYNLKRFVIFIANIQSSKHSYNVNVGCFLFEIDDDGKHMNVLPGKFTILQKNSPLSGKREVTEERMIGAEEDGENKIAITELKMEMNEGGERPSVAYLKPTPAPSERKLGNRGNHSQLENQNKPNDEESSIGSKKRKMDSEERSPDKTPRSGKKSGEGSLLIEDLQNLTINNEQPEEKSEEAMEQEQEMGQPVKNSQEEIKHDEQHDGESGTESQGKKAGKLDKNNQTNLPQAEHGKGEKEGKQRPRPELPGTETPPEAATQKQKEDEEQPANRRAAQSGGTTEEKRDSEDSPSKGPRPLSTVGGTKKKLQIKIESKKIAPKQRATKRKAGSCQTRSTITITTYEEQTEERSEEAIKEQDKKKRQEKKNQEEFKPDEQHDGEEGTSQRGRKAEFESVKGKAGSPLVEQEKAVKEGKPRVLPEPGKETKPACSENARPR